MKFKLKLRKNVPLIYWILLLFVPIEAISGIMANYGSGAINIVGYSYRGIIILLYARKFLKKKYMKFSILTLLTLVGVICNGFFRQYGSLSADMMLFIRLLYFETLCLGVADDALNRKLTTTMFEDIMDKSAYFVIFVYLLSFAFGGGLITYTDSNTGYKAFFNSTNSLTCVLIIISSFQVFMFLRDNKKRNLFIYIIISLFLFLLGSKSGIFFWGLYLLYSFWPRASTKYLKRIIGIAIVLPMGAYVLLNKFASQVQDIIKRFLYFQNTSDSTLQFLLSGRNSLLMYAWNEFKNKLTIVDVLHGKGATNMQVVLGKASAWGAVKNVEMDIFDIFFFYGLIGIGITYGLSFYLYNKKLKRPFDGKKLMFWICIMFSILGGHVYMDSFGSTIISLVVGLNLCMDMNCNNKSFKGI